jgi:hypothetical protein
MNPALKKLRGIDDLSCPAAAEEQGGQGQSQALLDAVLVPSWLDVARQSRN